MDSLYSWIKLQLQHQRLSATSLCLQIFYGHAFFMTCIKHSASCGLRKCNKKGLSNITLERKGTNCLLVTIQLFCFMGLFEITIQIIFQFHGQKFPCLSFSIFLGLSQCFNFWCSTRQDTLVMTFIYTWSSPHNLKYYYFLPHLFKRDLSKKEEKNVSPPTFLLFWSQINKSVWSKFKGYS